MHTSHQFLLSHGTDRKEHFKCLIDMVEKLKRFFLKFQMASCISWQSNWHPRIIIWNLDICLWISKKKLKRQAYGFTKPLVVCQNFAGWSVLAQLVFAGLQYPLSEPIPCVPCLLSDLNPSCNPPNHFFAKNFFMYLIFFFPLFQPRMWIWARRDREEWKDFQW